MNWRAPAPAAGAQHLLEPVGCNTAPAIVLAALAVATRQGEPTQMIALPADHRMAMSRISAARCARRRPWRPMADS